MTNNDTTQTESDLIIQIDDYSIFRNQTPDGNVFTMYCLQEHLATLREDEWRAMLQGLSDTDLKDLEKGDKFRNLYKGANIDLEIIIEGVSCSIKFYRGTNPKSLENIDEHDLSPNNSWSASVVEAREIAELDPHQRYE
jgi:hypothetical protein